MKSHRPKPPPGKWAKDGNCLGINPALMVPEDSSGTSQAKKICVDCPVMSECLEYALSEPRERHGVWGGTSERDRRRLAKQRMINRIMKETG